jgi:O-methyltransferase
MARERLHEPGISGELDQSVRSEIMTVELASRHLINECRHEVEHLCGDVAEIGVYTGQSARWMCELFPGSLVHLFDTFAGMPGEMVCRIDDHKAGEFACSVELVREHLKPFENYQIHQGTFPQTAIHPQPGLKFVHVDCDLYQSTRAALVWAWKHLHSGGVILDDDYGARKCRGAKKAVDMFAGSHDDCEFRVHQHRCMLRKR